LSFNGNAPDGDRLRGLDAMLGIEDDGRDHILPGSRDLPAEGSPLGADLGARDALDGPRGEGEFGLDVDQAGRGIGENRDGKFDRLREEGNRLVNPEAKGGRPFSSAEEERRYERRLHIR
jgi:hypothetical protein